MPAPPRCDTPPHATASRRVFNRLMMGGGDSDKRCEAADYGTSILLRARFFGVTQIAVTIDFDPGKRASNLSKHGLDLADAEAVFAGAAFTRPDDRRNYGEQRFVTVGYLNGRMVVIAWTPRDGCQRVINMRKANEREQAFYRRFVV